MSLSIFHSDNGEGSVIWQMDDKLCKELTKLMHQVPLTRNPVIMDAVAGQLRHCENCTHSHCTNKVT